MTFNTGEQANNMTEYANRKARGFSDDLKNGADNIRKMSIKELVEYRMCVCPERIFLKADGTAYAWRDIDRGSSVVARELYALGVRAGSHVALCGANSVNWILTFFAIQRLGAVAVLLNPQLTSDEISVLTKLGGITYFCLGKTPVRDRKAFLAQIADPEKPQIKATLDIGDEVNFLKKHAAVCLDVPTAPEDICAIMFTSGSTGTPKGVLLSPFYLLSSADYCVRNLRMTADDSLCAILPFFHIFGLTAVLLACVICACPMILPRSVKPDELMRVLKNENCTILHSIPTVLIRLVNAPGFSAELASSVRASYMSGAPVSEAQLKTLMDKFPNNRFMRRYGLTEMTPISSTGLEDGLAHILRTVGKPIDGTDVRIKDTETGRFCPAGIQGEILAKGRFLMSGYYRQSHDQQPLDGDGFFHTGDLGFLDEEGYLHYTGRVKETIIRGGEKIMPNEVASAISMYQNIVDVKVIGVPDEIYGEIVTAAVVLKEGVSFDGKEMRDFLMSRIARYKIPAYFFIYEKLPSLANGKVDALSLKKEIMARLSHIG